MSFFFAFITNNSLNIYIIYLNVYIAKKIFQNNNVLLYNILDTFFEGVNYMRVFTKKILISFLSVFIGMSVVACNPDDTQVTTPNDSLIPELSNPDEVFVSTSGYDITYGDLYEEVKKNDGLNQLLMMIDLDLLSDYVDQVTDEEIANKINALTYGTDDPDEIADFTDEEIADMDRSFADSMYLLGYGTNPEDYVKVVVAKELYVADVLNDDANIGETWYANANLISNYYNRSYFEDVQAIKIRFVSEANAKAVIRSLNLVSKNGELLLYTGETELSKVPSSALNETNTRSLTNEELLNKFLIMYNMVYGDYKDPVDEDSTYADVLTNDAFTFDYDSLLNVNANFPTFVYKTLGTYQNTVNEVDDVAFYTYEPVKYFANEEYYYYMILNLDRTEKVDLSDFDGDEAALLALLGQEVYDDVRNSINESSLASTTFISNRVLELRTENELAIYDYFLGVDYSQVNNNFEQSEEGHATVVASYNDKEITADQLLTFALANNAPLYTIYASQTKAVMAAHFVDVYCEDANKCPFDIVNNDSDAKAKNVSDLEYSKTQFEASYYSSYYTYEEYIYLAYGVKSEEELLLQYYVKSTLQPFFIYDQVMENNYDILNRLLELSQPYYDNYFSLDVEHLLVFVDRDEDGLPDDYDKFYAGLQDQYAYDMKLADFEAAIVNYLDDRDNTIATLISAYDKARLDDPVWGEFRSYGFYLMFENLGALTYQSSAGTYEQPFVDALVEIYKDYQSPLTSGEDFIYDDEFIQTSYGVHLIKASNNNDFEQPSALFTMTYDDEGVAEYLDGMVNLTNELTFDQVKIYADYRFTVIAYGIGDLEVIYGLTRPDIPKSVTDSINEYFSNLYDALYVVGYMNTIIADQLLSGTYENSVSTYCDITEAEFDAKLNHIIDIYMYQIFANYDQSE